jgi:hypothetical protein
VNAPPAFHTHCHGGVNCRAGPGRAGPGQTGRSAAVRPLDPGSVQSSRPLSRRPGKRLCGYAPPSNPLTALKLQKVALSGMATVLYPFTQGPRLPEIEPCQHKSIERVILGNW